MSSGLKIYDDLVVGCGSRGLSTLWNLIQGDASPAQVLALEASARIGGTQFLISRTSEVTAAKCNLFEISRTLPEIKFWWERNWISASEVDWKSEDWAYVLPQWKTFFQPLVELKVKEDVFEKVKDFVQLEKPVSEINYDGVLWTVRSGEKTYQTKKLHWTLGLKALQNALGKKGAEEFMEKNPNFDEAARDAEGVLVAHYPASMLDPKSESEFLGIPVRHESKLYLMFVSLHEGQTECFTFLHSDLLKQPKDLSFFEKSMRRTLKHTLTNKLGDLATPILGVFNEARGYNLASHWRLKNNPNKGIFFVSEDGGGLNTAVAATPHDSSPPLSP